MPEQLAITTYGMDILRKKTAQVNDLDTDLIMLVENMFFTMHNADGIGLAAPQVDKDLQLCVIDVSVVDEYKDIKPITLINPVILETHGEEPREEGCLSIPDVRGIVTRPETIHLKYNDFDMNEKELTAGGLLARVIQHEIDHLNGVLFVDHLDEDEFKKVQTALRKIKKNKIIPNYPILSAADKKVAGF